MVLKRGYEDDNEVEIDCEIRSDNPAKNAICIYTGNSIKVAGLEQEVYHWIPRSVLIEIRDDRKAVLVKRWFAEKEGLV